MVTPAPAEPTSVSLLTAAAVAADAVATVCEIKRTRNLLRF